MTNDDDVMLHGKEGIDRVLLLAWTEELELMTERM
jgi:hypothetical protein